MIKINHFSAVLIVCLLLSGCGQNPDVKKGKQFIEIGDYRKAAEKFEAAIQSEPKNSEAHYLLGITRYDYLDDKSGGLKELQLAIKSGLSGAATKLSNRADSFVSKKKWHDAANFQKLAVEAEPEDAVLYFRLGEILSNVHHESKEMANAFYQAMMLSQDEKLLKKIRQIAIIKETLKFQPITSNRGHNSHPVFFPGDNKVAWIRDPGGTSSSYRPPDQCLYMVNIKTGAEKKLFEGSYKPNFSRDGKKISFRRKEILDLETDRLIKIRTDIWPHPNPSLSPDGKKVTFSSYRNEGIFIFNLNDQKIKKITNAYDYRPYFLPGGEKIIYIHNYDWEKHSGKSIGIINSDGTNSRIIYKAPERKRIWNIWPVKNGNRILFNIQGIQYTISLDGKDKKKLEVSGIISDMSEDGKRGLIVHNGCISIYEFEEKEYTRDDLLNALKALGAEV